MQDISYLSHAYRAKIRILEFWNCLEFLDKKDLKNSVQKLFSGSSVCIFYLASSGYFNGPPCFGRGLLLSQSNICQYDIISFCCDNQQEERAVFWDKEEKTAKFICNVLFFFLEGKN